MNKRDQAEIVVAMFLILAIFSVFALTVSKNAELEKIKTDKVVELIWKKHVWKTKRLRVYTDIIYKND